MDNIFDSNVWIRAFTKSNQKAVQLVNEVENGQRGVRVTPYIFEEVFQALNALNTKASAQYQSAFATLVRTRSQIEGPSQSAVSKISLSKERGRAETNLIAEILDIQPKDAPIVVAAMEERQEQRAFDTRSPITIYTTDKPFSRLNPSSYGLAWLSVDFI